MSIKGKSKIQHKAGRLRDNGQRRKILNRVFPNKISKKEKLHKMRNGFKS